MKVISTGLFDFHKMVASVFKKTVHGHKYVDRVVFERKLDEQLNHKINEYKH